MSSIASFAESVTVEDLERDPFPIYRRLRDEAPVCHLPAVELTLVTRWDDVHHVALHPELFTADVDSSPLARTLGSNVLTVDGERQRRIRATMDPSMRPKAVAGYAPGVIEPIARRHLDAIEPAGSAELMAAYCEPVSVLSLGAVMGLADVDAGTLRRWFGPVTAWAAWSLVTIGAFLSPGSGPASLITGFFYNAQLRVWSHVSLLAPVLAALGVVLTASRCAVWLRRRCPVPVRSAAALLVVLAWLGYLVGPAWRYAHTNVTAVASRYLTPDFVRVNADDQRAISWLAGHVRPGQRVLNSANDGSTYLYVERGVPVLNVNTLGVQGVPYTYRLLESFRSYPNDSQLRAVLLRYNVAWVYVDSRAPTIGSAGSPEGWAGTAGFSLAPGLADLAGLPGLVPVFTSGTVTVYSLDLGVLRTLSARTVRVR